MLQRQDKSVEEGRKQPVNGWRKVISHRKFGALNIDKNWEVFQDCGKGVGRIEYISVNILELANNFGNSSAGPTATKNLG